MGINLLEFSYEVITKIEEMDNFENKHLDFSGLRADAGALTRYSLWVHLV